MYAALRWEEEDREKRVGKMLGVYWTREDAKRFMEEDAGKNQPGGPSTSPMGVGDEVMIPLSMFLHSKLRDYIIKIFGQVTTGTMPEFAQAGQVIEMGQLPRDVHMELIGKKLPSQKVETEKAENEKEQVKK